MSTNVISQAACTQAPHRPVVDIVVEKLARRMLSWSERSLRESAVRDRRTFDRRRLTALADQRSIATARPVRWY